MERTISRRGFLWGTAAAATAAGGLLYAQEPSAAPAPPLVTPSPAVGPVGRRSVVGLANGESRRKNIFDALVGHRGADSAAACDEEVRGDQAQPSSPRGNNSRRPTSIALHGVLDFLGPRFKGPVVVAESSAGYTTEAYDNFGYREIIGEHKPLDVSLVDPERRGKVCDPPDPQRRSALRARAAGGSAGRPGGLHHLPSGPEDPQHGGGHACRSRTWPSARRCTVPAGKTSGGATNASSTAASARRTLTSPWPPSGSSRSGGATVIDGFEGMEGNGPTGGTQVSSQIAIASTDYVAADRVGIETMGIEPTWVGYLNFCAQLGLGQNDLAKIDVRGPKLAEVTRKYKMSDDIERQLKWMGPDDGDSGKAGLIEAGVGKHDPRRHGPSLSCVSHSMLNRATRRYGPVS